MRSAAGRPAGRFYVSLSCFHLQSLRGLELMSNAEGETSTYLKYIFALLGKIAVDCALP